MRLLLLLVFVISCATKPIKEVPKAVAQVEAPKAYTGLQFSATTQKFDPPLKGSIVEAIRIENVMPDSPAYLAGLRAGDLILDEKDPIALTKRFRDEKVGSQFTLKVLSGVKIKEVTIKSDTRMPSQGHVVYKSPAKLWTVPATATYLEKKMAVLRDAKLTELYKEMTAKGDKLRPEILRFTQENPLSTYEVSEELLARLRKCESRVDCLSTLSLMTSKKVSLIKQKGQSEASHVKYIESVLRQTRRIHQEAFKALSKKELRHLEENVDELSDRFIESLYVHEDTFIRRKQRYYEVTHILDKVDLSKFQESLLFLASHFNKEYFEKLKRDLGKVRERISHSTPFGKIVIEGPEDNDHSDLSQEKLAILIDLGGEDLYRDISGMIVDISGNDRYESSLSWALGAAKMGSSFFLDIEGSDTYTCGVHCLGSSFLGSAFFADLAGNDNYTSQVYSQGAAFSGVSLFIDAEGNDNYTSYGFSQGVGIAGGLGVLLDQKGNDTYKSLGIRPSAYRDPGQYESWSQGVGIGLRFFVSGGMGLLYDREGQDSFDAGTFSQGGGYAFGWGALINDGQENDVYKSMRYGQAFAAHGAAGLFVDVGGNDQYFNNSGVCESIAWDLSVSLFEDKAGNDRHQSGGNCLGAPSHSSYAFFFDQHGVDSYIGNQVPISSAIPSDYHNTKSVGYFLDSGGLEDSYEVLKNNTCQKRAGIQVVCDE